MRQAAKKDRNQDEIVTGLRSVGVSVAITHQLGNGFPDIVAGYQGINYLFEIKDEAQPHSKQRLTKMEQEFFVTWRGSIFVIRNAYEALAIIGIDYDFT